nr:13130_t:CDS:2 [Entrophospora candida]
MIPSIPSKHIFSKYLFKPSSSSSCPSLLLSPLLSIKTTNNLFKIQLNHYSSKKKLKREPIKSRPELFTQQIVLSNGATFTMRTTSPKPLIKLIRDTRNHPLWNPETFSGHLSDESGQLSKFKKKFGEEIYDLDFVQSEGALPEITSFHGSVSFARTETLTVLPISASEVKKEVKGKDCA